MQKEIKKIIYKYSDEVIFDNQDKPQAELRIDVDVIEELIDEIINLIK